MTDILGRLTTSLADRYRVERELGQGGMATVYLAHDVRHDRKVALKVLRPELAAILGAERFLHEIRTTANLQHPHILPLHDSGEVDGTVFYVMPFVDGESLRDRLHREKQLGVDDALRIAREIADALHYAHGHGVVHRDIKPENILLHGGHAMVADFGIALAVSTVGGGTRMTETGMSLGTPHYMAPEQAMGDREITPRADIYALGCVLYEMLTGDPPFTGSTAQAIVARVVTESPRSLTSQRHTIPAHVEAVVMQALEKLPADRFANAAQFAEALARTDYVMPQTRAAAAVMAPRNRRAMVLASIPWLLLLAASGAGAWSWLRPRPVPPVLRNRIILREQEFPPGGFGRNVAIAPNDGALAFIDSSGGERHIFLKERGRLEPALLAGTAGAWGPVFSPDGAWIAFFQDGRLKKVPRLGGSAIAVADSANGAYQAIAWLDNDSIAFADGRFSLKLVHADGGPARVVFNIDSAGRGVISATPLPGGRAVLIGTCTPGCQNVDLRVQDLDSNAATVLSADVIKGWYTATGDVMFVRNDGGVFRAPFDLAELSFREAPVPVLDGVRTTPGRADLVLGAEGTLLYVTGVAGTDGVPSELILVTREGAPVPVDSGWSFIPAANFGAAPSPDGRRIALSLRTSGSDDIWIKDLAGGQLTRLTFSGVNTRPEWTADGRHVMFASHPLVGASDDVLRRRADGTGGTDTLVNLVRGIFEIRRLRDTMQLLIRAAGPPSRDVLLARVRDTTAQLLVAAERHDEMQPDLSPDERWLAYASNESGRQEVYVRPFPGVDGGRWQISRSGGMAPRWSPNGRELFFVDGDQNLVVAAISPGGSFAMGEPRRLFSLRPYVVNNVGTSWSVMPDGRRFLFLRNIGGQVQSAAATTVVRVDNWFAELSQAERR